MRPVIVLLCAFLLVPYAGAAEAPRIRVDDYQIDADLSPKQHSLKARARVKFTALEDLSVATFELHNGLRVTKALDAEGRALSVERVTQDSTIRVPLPAGLQKGASTTVTFFYEGVLQSADESPVPGLKLAYIGDDITYLLYAGRWFPVVGYGTNRFTATIEVTVPAGMSVIGSGRKSAGPAMAAAPAAAAPETAAGKKRGRKAAAPPAPAPVRVPGKTTFTFAWDRPSFPGTIIAGSFEESVHNAGGLSVRVYFTARNKPDASVYADTAVKELEYFTSLYGPAPSNALNVVELPNDTVPSAWGPEIAAIATRGISEKVNYRLLANTIAHQWWGVLVSPARTGDWWISDGFARYSEARYVESAAGQAGFEEATKDMAVGALAYDAVPLSSVGNLDTFSPEFQSVVTDKGGMILHMLRWVIGDAAFDKTMRAFASQFAWKAATSADFQKVAEANSGEQLTAFFTQWLDSTGAPEFQNKYTVYRLGTNKGFRVAGEITQDLDLFRMPIEVRVDTDGRTEFKRIIVEGTNSPYVVETFGKPRRIVLDPNNRVLKNSSDLKVRTAILRGQQLVQQGDLAEALKEFQKALESNKHSSLAHYRIAEVFFLQRNYQAAANAYRESLNGDGEPKWTEVWSHIQLGKIFDITGQRERAVNEYRQALQTADNTQGAQDEARKYLDTPYKREQA
ncbi:MAG TPA: M1 family aminopeptidase [Terriglobales bacterium]|nr:M1 family aminopeptidase [Terriglobales bacterium]